MNSLFILMVRGYHDVSVGTAYDAVSPVMPLVPSPVLISGTVGIGVGGDQQL